MKGQTVLICPQCGGNKVKPFDAAKVPLILSIFLAITIIGIPFAIATLIAWMIIKSNKSKRYTGNCQECKHNWKLTEEKFLEHKHAVHNNEKLQA
ncbi:MAG: hypothetical protein E6780_03845 [Staphylococcus epidermidis]|nr:hypothetical protein [Staphylococcus epidermidis]